ncbi:cyclic nucleotide-binding domain-containing protein, partial [Sphaerospermopsis aphanizomenoides BCCUSP55]|uniref:cyclic nucleotide-binding domain-containing protein n=1 Tax=Sphaerospermopsis aphanizomenoides TaxID=459663 RepID=UPI0019056296
LNPLVFAGADRICAWMRANPNWRDWFEGAGSRPFAALQADLDEARKRVEAKAAARKTFAPAELVRKFPLFSALSEEQQEVLILHFEPKSAAPGERIIRMGDAADSMYFIAEGEVEVCVGDREFKLGAGNFFGEMALITGEPRSADVTAIDFCRFATLRARDFRSFLNRYPEIRRRIAEMAEERRRINSVAAPDSQDSAPADGSAKA